MTLRSSSSSRSKWNRLFLASGLAAAAATTAALLVVGRKDEPMPIPGTIHYHEATVGNVSHGPGDGLPPKAPNPYFFAQRAYPLGEIPLERWRVGVASARALQTDPAERGAGSRDGGTWEFRGPTNIGGRITDLAVHPAQSDIVFAGTAEGGVVRTTNAGATWEPVFDDQPTLSIGAIAIDPTPPHAIYAGTGEVNPGGGSVAYGGLGMFRSTDLGSSWEPLGLEETGSIGRIVVDPADSDRIFVAAMGRLWSASEERGVYRTTDAGTTWERVLFVADDAGAVDLIQRPDQPDVLFAAIWQRLRQPEAYDYGGPLCAVYKTTNGGDSWSVVGGGLPAPNANDGRIGLSLCAGSPDFMHAVYADRTGFFDGLYRSTNGGASWTRTNDSSLSSVFASYGWWFGNVRTHPADPQRIFVLGLDFYRSTNGGASWGNVGSSMHVDHHALAFSPDASVIWAGNDGGLYRSTNGGTVWSFLGTQPFTQIYRVSLSVQNPAALLGGAQDNGTLRTTTGSSDDFVGIFGGDGFGPLVHPASATRMWAQYQYGSLSYTGNDGASWVDASGGIGGSDRRNWNSPLVQDPVDPERRYFGTNRLYRSNSNTSWTAVSPDLTGGPHLGNSGQVMGTLTTIGVSPVDNQVLWTGSDDGYLQVSTNGGGSWTRVDAALDDRWVTSVHPDPIDREVAYVTLSGFRWDEPLPRLHRTTNLGANWVSLSTGLPDVPLNDVFVDPEAPAHLFVASDFGVFASFDGGTSWGPYGSGLPNVVVTDFAYAEADRRLVAATYGRSIFQIDLPTAADAPPPNDGPAATHTLAFRAPAPNPMTAETVLRWSAAGPGQGRIGIFAVSGRLVREIPVRWNGDADASVVWDGRDREDRPVAAGVYAVLLRSEHGGSARTTVTVRH